MDTALEFVTDHALPITAVVVGLLYLTYYLQFGYFNCPMKGFYDTTKKNLGKTLPYYPNGWYIICKSKDLPPNTTKNIDISGQNIVVFRSGKGDVYALHAYCAHMGANLGVGGQVVNETCVQCPFHGWLFDGETGQCVGIVRIIQITTRSQLWPSRLSMGRTLGVRTSSQSLGKKLQRKIQNSVSIPLTKRMAFCMCGSMLTQK